MVLQMAKGGRVSFRDLTNILEPTVDLSDRNLSEWLKLWFFFSGVVHLNNLTRKTKG